MFNENISQSLDRNHSLSLFYSRRTPSKNKSIKKQSKFSLPTGECLSPANVNTPYNSITTPVLVHSLSDMSLRNEDVNDRSVLEDSPTPAVRYSKFLTRSNTSIPVENSIPLYPPQKLKTKSNSTSEVEGFHQMLLPSIQRRSRMSSIMVERKPVNLFKNFMQEEKESSDDSILTNKIEDTYINEKNQMNLDEQLDEQDNKLDECPCSNGFLNDDGIWEDPTLSQSESRCLQITVGNIMKSQEEYEHVDNPLENSDKTLMWEFEDDNKFNDKENIIPDDYKGGILAEREWCDIGVNEDSIMEEYDSSSDKYIHSCSSQNSSVLRKGKRNSSSSSSMIRKSEYQPNVRYAFQEISINSMPEYQMSLCDNISIYSNSNYGSTCDSMATPKKCSSYKMSNSYTKSNEFSNSFNNNNNNIDESDSVPSFFNTLPLIKSLKSNASTSSNKKSSNSKKLVYQLCGVPDLNAAHKKSIPKAKLPEKKSIDGEMSLNNNTSSYMNSSPIISKSSILSPPFLLSSPDVRRVYSSPLVQTSNNYLCNSSNDRNPFNKYSSESSDPFAKKDTSDASNEITPKPCKVKSLLTTSISNSLSPADGKDSKHLENTKTILKDTTCDFEEKTKKESQKITQNSDQIHKTTSIPDHTTSLEVDHSQNPKDTVFFPHYHSRHNCQIKDDNITKEKKKELDDSLIDQTSYMMSISPTTLSKINKSHQSFLRSNSAHDSSVREYSSSKNASKRGRISQEDKKKELNNRRRARLKKFMY